MSSPRLSSLAGLLLLAAAGCEGAETTTKLLVFSDPHFFAPALGSTGTALDSYISQDRKLLAESDAVVRAMVERVKSEKPDLVLVTGDLTKDGEQLSHQGFAGYLAEMEAAGATVLVIPGNHDILNRQAMAYSDTGTTPVPSVTPDEFAAIYTSFGYAEARERDPSGSLSYVAEPRPGLWILALDTVTYIDGASTTAGQLLPATLEWTKSKLAEARAAGATVIGMEHHGVVEHFRGQSQLFSEYLIGGYETVGPALAEAGLHVMLTGHFHANDVSASPAGTNGALFDVETGSAVTAPCAYRLMRLDGKRLSITNPRIDSIDYDLGGQDFQTYARDKLLAGLDEVIINLLEAQPYAFAAADAEQIAPLLSSGLVEHYAGDETLSADVFQTAEALKRSGDTNKEFAGLMLQSIHVDLAPADREVVLDLASGTLAK